MLRKIKRPRPLRCNSLRIVIVLACFAALGPPPTFRGLTLAPDGGFFQSGVRDRNTINGSEMNKPIDNAGEAILAVELVLVRYKPSLK